MFCTSPSLASIAGCRAPVFDFGLAGPPRPIRAATPRPPVCPEPEPRRRQRRPAASSALAGVYAPPEAPLAFATFRSAFRGAGGQAKNARVRPRITSARLRIFCLTGEPPEMLPAPPPKPARTIVADCGRSRPPGCPRGPRPPHRGGRDLPVSPRETAAAEGSSSPIGRTGLSLFQV